MVQKIKSSARVQKWLPLIVLSSALMIIVIDTTVLNVSIRDIVQDLNTDVRALQWVISAYSLTLAALMVTGGRLGDLYGRRKMFRIGAVLFAFGSIITAVAPDITWVIIGNALIEGIGAALMMPATAALLVNNYSGKDRALAFAIWGAVAASAAAIGPIFGGWLTTTYSWRWAFSINIFVVALLLAGSRFVREAREQSAKKELDFMGIVLSSVGLVSIVYGLIESSTYGWGLSKVPFALFGNSATPFGLSIALLSILGGLLLMGLFLWFERRRELQGHTPLVSLVLFQNKQFMAGSITSSLMVIGQSGMIFAIPIFYQSVLGLDAFHTGLGLLPMSLAVMSGAPVALRLTKDFTPKRVIQAGFIISLVGVLYMYVVLSTDSTPLRLAPGLFLFGFGTGFGFSQLGNVTLSAVSMQQSGEASGVNSTFRQIGSSFGSAIIGAALITTLSSGLLSRVESSSILPPSDKPVILSQLRDAGATINFESAPTPGVDDAIKKEVTLLRHQATVDGNKMALLLTCGFLLVALSASVALPNIRDLDTGKKAVSSGH